MKYKVISTLLTSPQKDFRAGDVLAPADLKAAGFNADFLIANGALSPLEGTEEAGDNGLLPGGVQGTDPLPMKTDPSAGNPGNPADLALDDAALSALDDAALSQKLQGAGLDTPEKVKAASDDDLKAIPGIGPATIAKIRASTQG